MTQAKPRFLSFEEYLSYEDDTDKLHELFNGELIEVPPESGNNTVIAAFLFLYFSQLVDFRRVRGHGLELEVRGEPRNRYPDLTIIRDQHIQQLEQRNTIRLAKAPPDLVIEIVSEIVRPGELQRQRDYIAKRLQYQDRAIPEYWMIDPEAQIVTVLELREVYEEIGVFRGSDSVLSPGFSAFQLTAAQILRAKI